MKATGIIRRIDDLGRIVIPKEIRRNMGIREGDPLEIWTDRDGSVTFKKYDVSDPYDQIFKNAYKTLSAEEKEAFKAEVAAEFKKLKMSLVKETIEGDTATLIVAAEGEKEHGKFVLKKVDGVWKIASMGNGD